MGIAIRWPDPLIEQAGIYDLLAPKGEALDARAFGVLATYEQAQAMIRQDRLADAQDAEWSAFFIESMVEFLVWSRSPAGTISTDDLDWLAAELAQGVSPTLPALLFALVRELNEVPERLTAMALRFSRNRHAALH